MCSARRKRERGRKRDRERKREGIRERGRGRQEGRRKERIGNCEKFAAVLINVHNSIYKR